MRTECEMTLLGHRLRVVLDDSLGVAGRVWPAQHTAARLARALRGPRGPRGPRRLRLPERLVELGCGCGALAAALALDHFQVIATDLPEVMPLAQSSAQLNAAPVICRPLRWGDEAAARELLELHQQEAIGVVACEVAYWGGWSFFEEDSREPLAKTLVSLLSTGGVGLLVHEVRDAKREASLLELLKEQGLEVTRLEPQQEPSVGEVGAWQLRAA